MSYFSQCSLLLIISLLIGKHVTNRALYSKLLQKEMIVFVKKIFPEFF